MTETLQLQPGSFWHCIRSSEAIRRGGKGVGGEKGRGEGRREKGHGDRGEGRGEHGNGGTGNGERGNGRGGHAGGSRCQLPVASCHSAPNHIECKSPRIVSEKRGTAWKKKK